jgi:hypothetical protein
MRPFTVPQVAMRFIIIFFSLLVNISQASAQDSLQNRCGTVELLNRRISRDPSLKVRLAQQEARLQQKIRQQGAQRADITPLTIPVVFHIVMTNPSIITDAQIQAQLDTLNKDYAGLNGDSVKIPGYFKPLFGKSSIRFVLAQRTPNNEVTNGVERITTTVSSFNQNTVDNVKHSFTGGTEAWNSNNYLNVWVCNFSGGLLGIATFPEDGVPQEQGVVIHFPTLPGGTLANYNHGKTLVHEVGHYFNLLHIWGDDNGACTGSDNVDDTPNQGNSTTGCFTGVRTDNCTPAAPGVMFQNYMDYSYDDCMALFTLQQVTRMETALTTFRNSYYNSNGALPLVRFDRDAELRVFTSPQQRLCTGALTPAVTLRNLGRQNLTSLTFFVRIDNGNPTPVNWTGNLATLAQTSVTLPTLQTTTGNHVLSVYTASPNAGPDQNPVDDTLRFAYLYYLPFNPPIAESFEGPVFPPLGWDIVNPDGSFTWEKVTGVSKTGQSSALIQNYNYAANDQKDYLRTPEVNLAGADSAFITFQLAASAVTPLNTANNLWDTLEVLISTDCGVTYESVYKRWGSNLITTSGVADKYFIPSVAEWRKDSINITDYIPRGNVLVAFRNTNEFENNIYIDDVNIYTKVINPFLKAKGFLLTPVPVSNIVTAQFYPQPVNLRSIAIYSSVGQKLFEVNTSSGQSNLYQFNMGRFASGMYVFRATFTDRVITQKFLKAR